MLISSYFLHYNPSWKAIVDSQSIKYMHSSGHKEVKFKFEIFYDTRVTLAIELWKQSKPHQFEVAAKPWAVERSFSSFEKCHRLWKNTERLLSTSKSMIELRLVRVLPRRLGNMGLVI